jgi:hypothetical protein
MYYISFNPLNAKLNPICPLLALSVAHHILHISRQTVKITAYFTFSKPASLCLLCVCVSLMAFFYDILTEVLYAFLESTYILIIKEGEVA